MSHAYQPLFYWEKGGGEVQADKGNKCLTAIVYSERFPDFRGGEVGARWSPFQWNQEGLSHKRFSRKDQSMRNFTWFSFLFLYHNHSYALLTANQYARPSSSMSVYLVHSSMALKEQWSSQVCWCTYFICLTALTSYLLPHGTGLHHLATCLSAFYNARCSCICLASPPVFRILYSIVKSVLLLFWSARNKRRMCERHHDGATHDESVLIHIIRPWAINLVCTIGIRWQDTEYRE